MTFPDFVTRLLPAAQDVQINTKLPLSFLIAQWAHETAWGTSYAAKADNNYGGLKPWWGESNPGISGYNHYQSIQDWGRGYAYFVQSNGNYQDALRYCQDNTPPDPDIVADKMGIWVGAAGEIDALTGQVISGPVVYATAIKDIINQYGLRELDLVIDRARYAAEIEPFVKGTIQVMIKDDDVTKSLIANAVSATTTGVPTDTHILTVVRAALEFVEQKNGGS